MHSICRMCIALSDRGNETSIKICSVLATNNVMPQYNIPVEVGKHQTTVLRQLRKLEKQGIVELVRTERSAKKGKDRKIFALTFKGMLWYLATFDNKDSEELIRVLERNGKRLQYPLFLHAKDLADKWEWMDIPTTFNDIAQSLLKTPSKLNNYQKEFLLQSTKHEKKLRMLKKLKSVKWKGEDPTQALEKEKTYVNMYIDAVHKAEDRNLRDDFYMSFLPRFVYHQKELPIPELHSYTEQLLKRKTEKFNSTKSLLKAGLALFGA